MADISSSEVSHFRRRVAEALDPELRRWPGLSPTNIAIISLILLSITLGIIETEEAIVGENGAYFMAAEALIFILFLVEYVLRVWSSTENSRHTSRWEYARKPAPLLDLATLIIIGADLAGTQGSSSASRACSGCSGSLGLAGSPRAGSCWARRSLVAATSSR